VNEVLAALARLLRARLGGAAPQGASVIVTAAAAPFAPNSFARARLLRQLHACGRLEPDGTGVAR
jgi:hypothetical protein